MTTMTTVDPFVTLGPGRLQHARRVARKRILRVESGRLGEGHGDPARDQAKKRRDQWLGVLGEEAVAQALGLAPPRDDSFSSGDLENLEVRTITFDGPDAGCFIYTTDQPFTVVACARPYPVGQPWPAMYEPNTQNVYLPTELSFELLGWTVARRWQTERYWRADWDCWLCPVHELYTDMQALLPDG